MRTDHSQLPTYQELCDILAHEATRPLPTGKEQAHYGDFSTIIELLKSYDLPTRFFEEDITFDDLKDEDLFHEVSSMFADLTAHILDSQEDPTQQDLFDNLYEYLSEEDQPEASDLIFVFGSKSTLRIDKAARLYQDGFASKILISGRGPLYDLGKGEKSEAEILAEHARAQGVPKEALILETESITVPDNVKSSLNLLERDSIPHQSIILVNSPFSQRRGWAHFSKMTDEGTKLIRSNTDTVSEQYSRDGWYKNEVGARVITKEFFGLRLSHLINTS